jgi:molecular chaperone DnaJ
MTMMSGTKRDFYEVLGVDKSASDDDIQKAYRKLAMKYHPDKNQGNKDSEDKFKEATQAYETLKDPAKKSQYDNGGMFGGNSFGAGFNSQHNYQGGFSSPFDNIFSSMFGQGQRQHSGTANVFHRGNKGQDIKVTLEVNLEDIYFGSKKTIKYKRHEKCSKCSGKGSLTNEKLKCLKCNGMGQTTTRKVMNNMVFENATICDKCMGQGHTVNYNCVDCSGTGRVISETTVEIVIDAGTEENKILVLKYYGNHGEHNGVAGNLLVVIKSKPHDYFTRYGNHLLHVQTISLTDAVLGTTISIKTMKDEQNIIVPAGTIDGSQQVLLGYGLPKSGISGGIADQIIEFKINIPQKLTEKQTELFKQLKQEGL